MTERLVDEVSPARFDQLDVHLNASMDGCPNPGAEIVVGAPVVPEVVVVANGSTAHHELIVQQQ